MVRTIAPLVYYNRVDGTYIKVGTGSWQQWLSQNSRFTYESFWGSFTACKEYQGEEIFWLAYRRVKEQTRCAYLGASKDLTVDKLVDTAKQLSASDTTYREYKSQTKKNCKTSRNESEAILQEIERNAVSLWCIFYTHPDGRVEFMGGCWEKDQALTQIQNLLKQAHDSLSVGDMIDVLPGSYEVREELVLPVGYPQKRFETNSFGTEATTKEVELLHQVSELRHHLSDLLSAGRPTTPAQYQ